MCPVTATGVQPHRWKWWCFMYQLLLVLPVLVAGQSNSTVIIPHCIQAFWPTLASRCQGVQRGTTQPGDVASTVTLMLSSCIQDASTADSKVANLLAPQLFYLPQFMALVQAYTERSNISVSVTGVPFTEWGNILNRMAASRDSMYGNTTMHGFIVDNVALGSMNQAMLLADLTGLILTDSNLQWLGVHSFYRNTVITQSGLISATPLGGLVYQMYYREDVLAAFNLTVPNTWDDLVTAASIIHNKPFGPANTSVAGVCMQRAKDCFAAFTLSSIWASIAAYQGTSQGLFFDPNTMQHQMGTLAMKRAMEIYITLGQYAHPATKNLCFVVDNIFLGGKCAFGFGWPAQFKANSLSAQTKVANTAGVSLMPGSTVVYDRTAEQLVTCTPSVCPHGRMESVGFGAEQQQALVNRAPFMPLGAVSGGISPSAPFPLQQLLFGILAYIGGPVGSWKMVLNPSTEMGPFRMEHFDPMNLPRWTAVGYNGKRAWDFLTGVQAGLEHPNVAAEPRIPVPVTGNTRNAIRQLLNKATNVLDWAPNMTAAMLEIDNTMRNLSNYVEMLYGPSSPNFETTRSALRFSVGWKPPVPPPSPAVLNGSTASQGTGGATDGRLGHGTLTAIIACSVLGLLVLLLLVLVCWYRAAATHQQQKPISTGGPMWQLIHHLLVPANLMGPVLPPGKGPETSLVVTDVEKSTELWEALNPAVMDVVWNLHHGCMRVHASKYRGYESQTEGDSFIIGFESPELALRFCLDVQKALCEVDWPPALLAHPLCSPQWSVSIKKRFNGQAPLQGKHSSFRLQATAASALSSSHKSEPRRVVQRVRHLFTAAFRSTSAHQWEDQEPHSQEQLEPVLGEGWATTTTTLDDAMSRYLVSLAGNPTQTSDTVDSATQSGSLQIGTSTVEAHWAPHPHVLKPFSAAQIPPQLLSTSTSTPTPANQDGDPDIDVLMTSIMSNKSHHSNLHQRAPSIPRLPPHMSNAPHPLSSRSRGHPVGSTSRGGTSVCSNPGSQAPKSHASASAGHLLSELSQKPSKQKHEWRSLLEVVRSMWVPAASEAPGAVLVWRGLKVRMGIATGMHVDSDLVYNEAAGRHKYSGAFLATSRAISHVAHGGHVILSHQTLEQLPTSFLQDRRQRCILFYMGEYEFEEHDESLWSLYLATHNWSLPRLCESRALRAHRLAVGALEAPTGQVAYACFKVVGSEVMRAAGGLVYQEVFGYVHELLLETAHKYGGYITQGARRPGWSISKLSCAFKSAHVALCWALEMQRGLRWHAWSATVLQDPHCEEICVGDDQVVFRGPRCKAVVVFGEVGWRLDDLTGSVMYHGEVMQSLQQLMKLALTGMVVASPAATADARRTGGRLVRVQQPGRASQTGMQAGPSPTGAHSQGANVLPALSVAYSSDATSRSTNPKRTTCTRPGALANSVIKEASESGSAPSLSDRALAALRSMKGASHSAPGTDPATPPPESRMPAGLQPLLINTVDPTRRPASDAGSPPPVAQLHELTSPTMRSTKPGQGATPVTALRAMLTSASGFFHHAAGALLGSPESGQQQDATDSSSPDALQFTASSVSGTTTGRGRFSSTGEISASLNPPARVSGASSVGRIAAMRGSTASGASGSSHMPISRLSSMRKNASFTTMATSEPRVGDEARRSSGLVMLAQRNMHKCATQGRPQQTVEQRTLSTATSSPLPTQISLDACDWEARQSFTNHRSQTDQSLSTQDVLLPVQEDGDTGQADTVSGIPSQDSLQPTGSYRASASPLMLKASRGLQMNALYQQTSHNASMLSSPRTSTTSFMMMPDDARVVYINMGYAGAPESPVGGVPAIPESATEAPDSTAASTQPVTGLLPASLDDLQAINLAPVQLYPKGVSAIGMRKGVLMYMATLDDGNATHETQTRWVLHDSRPSPPTGRASAWRKSLHMLFGSQGGGDGAHTPGDAVRFSKQTPSKRLQGSFKDGAGDVSVHGRASGRRDRGASFDVWQTATDTTPQPGRSSAAAALFYKQPSEGKGSPGSSARRGQAKLVPIAVNSPPGALASASRTPQSPPPGYSLAAGSFTRASGNRGSRGSWMAAAKPRLAWLQQLLGDEAAPSKQSSFSSSGAAEAGIMLPVQRKVSFSMAATASSNAQPATYQPATAPERSALSRPRLESLYGEQQPEQGP